MTPSPKRGASHGLERELPPKKACQRQLIDGSAEIDLQDIIESAITATPDFKKLPKSVERIPLYPGQTKNSCNNFSYEQERYLFLVFPDYFHAGQKLSMSDVEEILLTRTNGPELIAIHTVKRIYAKMRYLRGTKLHKKVTDDDDTD